MSRADFAEELNANIETLVKLALFEDLGNRGDITSQALIGDDVEREVFIVSRQDGVISGIDVANKVFDFVDMPLEVQWILSEGDSCISNEKVAVVKGKLASILAAERTSLNFLQHLSGVATLTRKFVDVLESVGSTTKIRDTRKTLPGYRMLEKQAVRSGGGENHRMGLYDAFLVKDNHLSGSEISEVVKKCRDLDPGVSLEVEVDSLDQLKVVLDEKPDLVLLDNFSVDDVIRAQEIAPDISFEISGGVNLGNLASYGLTNVKYIAVGAITHSAPILDIGFDLS